MPRKREPKMSAWRPNDVRAALRRAGNLLIDETRYLNGGYFANPRKEHDFYWVGNALLRFADGEVKSLDVACGVSRQKKIRPKLVINDVTTDLTITPSEIRWVSEVETARYDGKGWPPEPGEDREPVPWEQVAEKIRWRGSTDALRDRYTKLQAQPIIQAKILEAMGRKSIGR
jgi:hypothetical protein